MIDREPYKGHNLQFIYNANKVILAQVPICMDRGTQTPTNIMVTRT
jgi:hypothetical protein